MQIAAFCLNNTASLHADAREIFKKENCDLKPLELNNFIFY